MRTQNYKINKLNKRDIGVALVLIWASVVTVLSTKSNIINALLY